MSTATEKDARLDFRLPAKTKQLIEQAAVEAGQSLTDFAVSTLIEKAHEVIERGRVTELTNRDRDLFIAMLERAAPPNAALRAAAREHKRRVRT
ncbi:MAG TPA: DUF1778 domain-containing protein [Pirellulales bacterium]|nr:DUF1778 domain-containing protein [Pirellulales bacterium]